MARLILGESTRTLDERYRLSIPPELAETLAPDGGDCILAKERPGCLSLWSATAWQGRLDAGIQLVEAKIEAGRLEGRVEDVQRLGRLLSTRHRPVQLAGRSRLVVPEGFREFLGVEPGSDAMVVGAAVCVEIWHPEKWSNYIGEEMPAFRQLLDQLSG
ncbi:MAG: division/cell wall cluster transcriptional repressor MraZ [Pirellulales bacterium]